MPDDKKLREAYSLLKQNNQFSKTKSYGEFQKKMDDRNYNSHIWKLLKDNGANVGHPYQFRAHLGVDEYNTANRKSSHVYSSNKPAGPSVPSGWGQLDTDAVGSGKMVGDTAKERATETEGNIQAMNDDVTNPHVRHAVQQGITAQKNRLNNTNNQNTQQYGANWHQTDMLDKGIKGDAEAQKASGMQETAQQMQDNLQYEEATGKPLHNVLDVGMDKDRYGDITGSPAFAPTVQRDEQGNLVTNENGQPLIGMTSDEGNVREYGQQAQDEVIGQKKADIAESAKNGSLADESNKLFDALTSSDPQTKEDAVHRLREIRSLGDDNANSILMKAFVDRQRDQNNEDLSNAKMQSDQDAGTDIANMGALGKNEGDPYLVGTKEDEKNNVGTYAAIDNMLNDTESHLKEFHKEQDEQNSSWLVRNGSQTARRTGKELTDINNWDSGVTALNNSKEMLQAVEAYKHHNANSAQMKLLQAAALNNQVKDKYPLSDAYELVGQTTGQMIPFMVQIAMGGALGLGKIAAKSLSGTLARNLPKLAGKKFMGKTFSAISGRLASDMVDAGMTTVAIQGQSVAADTINRHIGDAQGGLDNSGQVKYTGQKGGESWGKSLYKATADAMFNNWSEYWGEYLPSVGHGMNKVAQKALDKVHLGAVNRFVAGADRSKGFQIYKNIRNRFELQGPFREWMEEMLGNSASAIATGDQSLSDIWSLQNMKDTALALSLGCGFGSITGGAAYLADVAGSKHSVHKAANRAAQAFGDKWDSVKDNVDRELDNAVSSGDNESVTDKITPQSMTPEQKKALSSYAMNRMYYRGMVYGVNAMMNDPKKPKDEKQVETSYIRGTDVDQPDDMNNIKREYELQRQKVSSMVGDSAIADVDKDPMSFISNTNADQPKQQAILDYTNAKAAYDGMINNAHDDIESRVEDSNAAVDSHVNKSDNLIHPATMKLDDRPVYVVSGKMQMMQDGSMVDKANSDDSIIIRDGATGKLEMTSADQIQSVDEPIDPEQEKQEAANNIRQQFSQEKAEQIDGVLPFNTGDNYTFLGDDGKQHAAQIIGPDQNQENVLAVIDGNQQAVSIAKQELQQGVDNYKETNVQSNNIESNQAQPNIGDDVQVNGDNGAPVHGVITGYDDLENKYMVQTDSPVNGKITQPYTSDQLISPSTDDANIRTENGNKETDNVNNITDNGNFVPDNGNSTEQDKQEKDVQQPSESEEKKEQPQVQQRAIDRIPVQNVSDNKGNITAVHNWEQAAPQDTYDALKEVYQNNEDITKHKIGKRINRLDKQIKDIQKKQDKLDDNDDFDADIANADTYKQLADGKKQLEQQKKYWQSVQSVPANRQIDAEKKDDEERKAVIEAKEKAKAEDEENARVEREKLKGVPDVTNDKPADARSRGFRSVNGHQIQRQDATEGLTGKESNVKFSNKDTVQGHLKVIDADQLQPSHLNGQRNPSFFIDEAQPKNRTDNVSSMAAEKIAANINPKEITGDGSAYQFSAPTVNTHGEVIQGNNRSDALKLMYSSPAYSEAQDAYKKYLMDHAEENGLDKDALSKIQHPVMVNELNVPDEEAIRLGQLTSKDNESGGVERIDPVTASRTLGNKVGRFANVLLGSSDEDESINDLMAANGNKAITWLSNQGAISPTQVQSAFDTKGNLTPEAKMDLQNILKQSLFQGGVSDLPTMFNAMPAKAQKAILSTFMRDFDSAEDDRILPEIQNAIEVWYEASKSAPEFAQAKNYEEAKRAMQGYTHQTSLTESSLPTEHYSNLAFELACRLQGLKMKGMQQTLSDYFDLVQGKTQPDLFGGETPGEQLKRADAIRKVFDIEYKPINNKYNGQERSNDVDSDAYESKQGRQREPGNDKDRGPDTQGTESAERGGGIENNVQDQGNLHEGGRSKEQISKESHSSSESGNGETTELKNNDHPEKPSVNKAIEEVCKDVDIHPTDAQKEAGNYKKGHVQIGSFDITVENPKGSERSGKDANGNPWSITMQNTYGYIRGTEGVDGDHIDVFLSDDFDAWNGRRIFVVDQYNEDGTFDEHKVMLGFNDIDEAESAYYANYSPDWKEKHPENKVTSVNAEDFEKWIDSSHRKTKPFAEYANVKTDHIPNATKMVEDNKHENDEENDDVLKNNANFAAKSKENGDNKETDQRAPVLQRDSQTTSEEEQKVSGARPEVDKLERRVAQAQRDARSIEQIENDARTFAKENGLWIPYSDIMKHTPFQSGNESDNYIDEEHGLLYKVNNLMHSRGRLADNFKSAKLYNELFPDTKLTFAGLTSISEKGTVLPVYTQKFVNDAVFASDDEIEKYMHERGFELTRKEAEYSNGQYTVSDLRPRNVLKNADGDIFVIDADVSEKKNSVIDNTTDTVETQKNRLVTDERYEELKKRMKAKLNNLNMGIDPEILAIGTEMAVYHIEKGARKFADYAKGMIADMGDAIRPYLKAFYNGARDLPEMDDISKDMSPYDEVRTFNVATIGKEGKEVRPSLLDTAEQISNEATIEQHKPTIQQAKTAGLLNDLKKKEQKPIISDKKDVSLEQEPGLFDSFFKNSNNKKENKDGLQRTNELRSKRLSTDSSQSQRDSSKEQAGSSERGREENRRLEQQGGRKRTEPDRSVQSGLQRLKNQSNNHAQRGKDYAPHDVDSRIQANIDAIELMQKLITEGRKATSNEMSTLRKFSGWGGLGKAFKEDDSNSQKLRNLLGDDAYDQAIMSRNSAYYTPAPVIDTLWDIAKSLGFKGGNILEGSAGIGNILGLMPKDMSDRSNIHAVEIDDTSGNILSLLYPDAKVDVQGFEKTKIPNGSVDLAITNVPFVTGLRVQDTTGDKDLSQKFHDIHDFCIAKNVRKLRDGGIGLFITSNGTLDNSQKLRNWITSDGGADVIGAFRMNNKTFGGTSATSDIIVIRKRLNGKTSAHAIDISDVSAERTAEYDTGEIKKGKTVYKQLPMVYNAYFIRHPENMGGVMKFGFENGDTFRPTSKGLFPQRGINQKQRMEDWVSNMKDTDNKVAQSNAVSTEEHEEKVYEDLGPDIKEGSLLVNKDGQLCVATYGQAVPLNDNGKKVKGHPKVDCFNSYTAIKDAVNEVLNYESAHEDDKGLQPLLDKLNKAYDSFVNTYGHFNKNTAISFLKNDIDYSTISALESYNEYNDDKGNRQAKYTKSDIFSKRVVTKETEPKATNVKEGIVTSIYKFGRVDLPFLSEQLNRSEEDLKHDVITQGLGFENPVNQHLEVSYEYLSGNVREKLDQAKENNEKGQYNANIKALQKVIPMNIPSHLIDFTLGSSWLEPSLYDNYIKDKTGVDIKTQNIGGTWIIPDVYGYDTEKNRSMGVHSDKFNKTIFGHDLITAAMQNKSIVVSHTYKDSITGGSTTITDKDATQNCATKIDEIRSDFKEWARSKMQQNPEMAEKYEKIYNDKFNNYVPKEIPDNFVPEFFYGANHKIHLLPHQAKAAVRGTTQNILLAHEVGTGKTFTLITTAMEMRRLGTANKPMIVVQNATVGQFVSSAKFLYPKAKILTLEDGDRDAEGRKAFYAKIKYNDWDMVVIPQSTLERIPDSDERQISFIQDKIQEKMDILEQMKDANADDFAIRNAQNEVDKLNDELGQLSQSITDKHKQRDAKKDAVTKQNAEVRAREMLDRKVDDVDNFDKMGIDALLVDEAHEYKHLGFATAMTRGVKGIDPSFSKKSQGVYLKCQSVMEKTGGKNVIFATGTPISNTAAEIWTFMRYLMPADVMKQYDIYYFDDFARNFGNISQHTEFTTSGKYKDNNRFIGYLNLPELVRIWSGASDTVLTDEVSDLKTKIPELEGGKATDVYLPQTRALRSVMKFVRSELDKYDKMSGKEKRANSAIPLKMYSIAKAAAIDPRLVMEDAEDEANSKTNTAVKETVKALDESKNYKGTCAIFADNYQNKQSGFNLYDEIRRKLITAGVPEEQIVIMRPGMSIKKKEDIFSKVNAGDVRVIMGSTSTLGTGVNIQERLKLLIHMDAPNRPMDYTQRMGRILRQGNLHKAMNLPVRVIRFGVEDSLDVTAYQRLKTKGAIADSIMHGKRLMENSMENRSIEEEDDQFGDTVAQLSGSQYALLKQQAEREVRKLEAKKKQWEADQIYIHHQKPRLKGIINDAKTRIEINDKNLQQLKNRKLDEGISVGKHVYKNIDAMADFFKDYNKNLKEAETSMRKGNEEDKSTSTLQMKVNGFDFAMHTALTKETEFKNGNLAYVIHRTMTYSCPELNLKDVPVRQGYLRNAIDDIKENVLSGNDFKEQKEYAENDIKRQKDELSQIEKREGKPFQFTDDLQKAQDRFEDYNEKMKDELEAKEAKYAKMDDEVKAATKLSNDDNTDDTRYREGISFDDGQGFAIHKDYDWNKNKTEYSVDGLNDTYPSQEQLLDAFRNKYENYVSSISPDGNRIIVEPWSKYLKPETGKYTKEQQAHIEQKTNNAQAAIDKFAHKLNLDNTVSVLTSTDHLEGRRAKAKGWYDVKTGKIVVVLPNHTSIDDVIRTLLHEGVAHYGLRKLFGQHFNDFLNNVYINSNEEVRKQIADLALKKYNGDFGIATEEHLASLAEDTDFERAMQQGWWGKVKNLFLNMLAKAGIKLEHALSDNDLRYVLWRSYKNLEGLDPYKNIFDKAEDISTQNHLGVGNYAKSGADTENVADTDRFRDKDDDELGNVVKGLREEYDNVLSKSRYQVQEALQDSMLSLKKLMGIIQKHSGQKEIADWENPYMAENALSSRDQDEANRYVRDYYTPLMKSLRNLQNKEGVSMEQISDYVMAKHGIERNREMAVRSAITDHKTGNMDLDQLKKWNQRKNDIREQQDKDWYHKQKELDGIATNEFGADLSARDYSGLTSLYDDEIDNHNDVSGATFDAYRDVDAFEKNHNTKQLDTTIHNATQATLEKMYTSGLISKATLNNINQMYDYYVPLRGFNEKTADEVYAYVRNEKSAFNAPIKQANGRSSKADNPFAYIANMADSAILQGNRNLMKQQFLNFIQNRPSDLVSISDMWIRKDPATGDWVTTFPNIPDNATPEEVNDIVEEFNKQMEKESGKEDPQVKRIRGNVNVPYRLLYNELSSHQVVVKRAGHEYVLTINANPRASMALNGLTNPHSDYTGVWGVVKNAAEYVNKELSAFYTTRNPDFVASNFVRDAIYGNSMVWVKEKPRYAVNFNKNYVKYNPAFMAKLYHKYNHNTLDMNDKIEKEFNNFMRGGGETGYSNIKDIENTKKKLQKDLNNSQLHKAKAFLDKFDIVNRSVENCTRFAAYMTSREENRSIQRSVYDAKEISVNFNKKGSGGTFLGKPGQTRLGNFAAGGSELFRTMFVFFNAGVQGSTNLIRAAKEHPAKFSSLAASYFILGFVAPALMGSAGGNGDDDKDHSKYDDLPDYVRRSNVIIKGPGKSYISLPLPVEFRTLYGMGELANNVITGKERLSNSELALEMAKQVSQALPVDLLEGEGFDPVSNMVPSFVSPVWQAYRNKDWTGVPIYKDHEFNKNMPEWTKAPSKTNRHLVDLSKAINEATGGDDYKKGWADNILNNPAVVESIAEGYFGGAISFLNKASNSIDMWTGKMNFDWRNIPIANRLVKSGDKHTHERAINQEFYDNLNIQRQMTQQENGYKKIISAAGTSAMDRAKYLDKLNVLYKSDEYKNMQAFKYLHSEISKLQRAMNDNGIEDPTVEQQIWNLKEQANQVVRDNGKELK